mmetsp:Transcript_10686/g.24925  ORF Transcript_10686/g.24925 Transcript_10686/m.24925 type:complete len:208 (+) Transcript_10686:403-1026(+)
MGTVCLHEGIEVSSLPIFPVDARGEHEQRGGGRPGRRRPPRLSTRSRPGGQRRLLRCHGAWEVAGGGFANQANIGEPRRSQKRNESQRCSSEGPEIVRSQKRPRNKGTCCAGTVRGTLPIQPAHEGQEGLVDRQYRPAVAPEQANERDFTQAGGAVDDGSRLEFSRDHAKGKHAHGGFVVVVGFGFVAADSKTIFAGLMGERRVFVQ